jgi:regulator of protease activity HflC (stomatin/prohibitin superfamily)
MEVKRYEITEVRPDKTITLAMDKQAAAERNRREMVIKAEGMLYVCVYVCVCVCVCVCV